MRSSVGFKINDSNFENAAAYWSALREGGFSEYVSAQILRMCMEVMNVNALRIEWCASSKAAYDEMRRLQMMSVQMIQYLLP